MAKVFIIKYIKIMEEPSFGARGVGFESISFGRGFSAFGYDYRISNSTNITLSVFPGDLGRTMTTLVHIRENND